MLHDANPPIQAITPTLIIILAALQLTTNDVHSRLTRSKGAKILRPNANASDALTDSTRQIETMQFAQNQGVLSRPKSTLVYAVDEEHTESKEFGQGVGIRSAQSHLLV